MGHVRFPLWLHRLAIGAIAVAIASALVIVMDECRKPQKMWIMNLVWPLTAFRRADLADGMLPVGRAPARGRQRARTPLPVGVAIGMSLCGAGCTLGDSNGGQHDDCPRTF